MVEAAAFHAAFSRPASVQGDKVVSVVVEVHAHGQYSLNIKGGCSCIFQTDAAGDNVKIVEHRINQYRFKSRMLVNTGYLESFRLVFVCKGSGKSLQSGLALIDLVGLITQVGSSHTLAVLDHKAWLAVVSRAVAWILKRCGVHKSTLVAHICFGNPWVFGKTEQVCKVVPADFLSEIAVNQIALVDNSENVACAGSVQLEHGDVLRESNVVVYLPCPAFVLFVVIGNFNTHCNQVLSVNNYFKYSFISFKAWYSLSFQARSQFFRYVSSRVYHTGIKPCVFSFSE